MSTEPRDDKGMRPSLGDLERSLIDEYVRARGFDPQALDALPPEERRRLLKDASIYASTKLSEVESRSRFVHDIHEPS